MGANDATADGLTISVCGAGDRGLQAELYDRCFGRTDGATTLPWRYDENPHGAAVTLVATTEDGRAVSGYACSPRIVLSHGVELERCRVGQTGDVMTVPERRGEGIFSALDRAAMERAAEAGWPVVFGLPNRQSAEIFTTKLGWRAVGCIRPWTFVLHADAAARAERMRAGRLAAAAVPLACLAGIRRRGRLRDRSFDTVNVVPIPRFGPDVDAVVTAVAKDWPWMVRRDHGYLNWRFLESPSGRFKAHGAYEQSGTLRGYCIVQLPGAGEAAGHVVDVVGVDDAAFCGALEAALSHLHKAGASVARAHAVAGSWWEARLREAGFRPPKRDDQKIVIARVHDAGHPLAKAALEPASWYFTDGDRDDELVR